MNNDPKRRLSRPELPGISAIFNPRKLRRNSTAVSHIFGNSRTPSVVVTDDNLEVEFGGGSPMMIGVGHSGGHSGGPQGMANGPHNNERGEGRGVGSSVSGHSQTSSVPLLADVQQQSGNAIVTLESSLVQSNQQQQQQANNTNLKPIAKTIATIRRAIFSKTARKLCCGLFLSILVGCCWTAVIHSIKRTYLTRHIYTETLKMEEPSTTAFSFASFDSSKVFNSFNDNQHGFNSINNHSQSASLSNKEVSSSSMPKTGVKTVAVYDAPFFTAWILTICTILFYPIHQITVRFCSCMGRKGPKSMSRAVSDAVQGFRERGMTLFQFIGRCTILCCLWLLTNWLIVASLRVLKATEVLALFATTTSFVYLLSWVVLHQQFVGLRILAVILSNMGIALFAYMDGQTHKSKTVGGVILGATAAGSSAVFKVSLKKSFGFGATISQQVALIFSVMGIISMIILWPIFVTLYFTGIEVIKWSYVPWNYIIAAIVAFLTVAMLDNFGVTCTFEFFITVGLLMAIPFSAVLDCKLYMAEFDGMCLAGIITVGIGFCVVLLPENWPDYITRLIRYLAQLKHHSRWGRNRRGQQQAQEPIDTRTGHIRSHLRSPSGRVR